MNDTDGIAPALAYLGLGSNLGERSENLKVALETLDRHPEIELVAVAEALETPPMYVLEQPHFMNTCAAVRTTLDPRALLEVLLTIETAMGRERQQEKGPRLIDLDVLFYDSVEVDEPGLTLPHPAILERAFVLLPLAQIAPDLVHPGTGRTIAEHAAEFQKDASAGDPT